ncbi:DoxX family protein [Ramlibacter sp. 2FC]|uniref:DoxX family protein n=1 Tax=Ramlibacter sp. 2FC TaxID=2502188 RepID=UPI0010F6A84A|nr:DoxX family protein [Ramlibacter sp. 2FC]
MGSRPLAATNGSVAENRCAGTRRALVAGICLPFLFSGIAKLANLSAAVAESSGLGLPLPAVAVALTILVQLGGSAALILGRGRPAMLGALALAGFTVLATLIAHAFWRFDGPARMQQANIFVEHLSIAFALGFAGWAAGPDPANARRSEGKA